MGVLHADSAEIEQVHFQQEFIRLRDMTPQLVNRDEPGLGAHDDTRQISQVRSGLQVRAPAAPLSQHPLLTNLQGWIDVSHNGNCFPALTCLEIRRTQNREKENIRKKSEWKNLHTNQPPVRVQGESK